MEKHRDKASLTPREVISKCGSTAYSEPPTESHNAVITTVAAEIFKECHLNKKSYIVEIGAGHGQFLQKLHNLCKFRFKSVTVNILEEDSYECSSKGFINVKKDMHDFTEFGSNWLHDADLVVMRHILEHSPFPFFILSNIYAILKKGSYVYVEVPAPDSWAEHEFNQNHYSVMGAKMWRSLFLKAGFTIKRDWNIQVGVPQPSGDTLTDTYFGFILEI